jgi:hypothetical protein
MSTEMNEAMARLWLLAVIARGQLALTDEIFHPHHVIHDPDSPPGGWARGPEGVRLVATMFGGTFEQWDITIDNQIAEHDHVATRWSAEVTHTGALLGIRGSGKRVKITGVNIARFVGGKIIETWFNVDMLSLLRQIAPDSEGQTGPSASVR